MSVIEREEMVDIAKLPLCTVLSISPCSEVDAKTGPFSLRFPDQVVPKHPA